MSRPSIPPFTKEDGALHQARIGRGYFDLASEGIAEAYPGIRLERLGSRHAYLRASYEDLRQLRQNALYRKSGGWDSDLWERAAAARAAEAFHRAMRIALVREATEADPGEQDEPRLCSLCGRYEPAHMKRCPRFEEKGG